MDSSTAKPQGIFCVRKDEREAFSCAGINFEMLLPRDATGCCEAVIEHLPAGSRTPADSHSTFHQIFYILKGEALLQTGDQSVTMTPHCLAFVPRRTPHQITSIGTDDLVFLYVNVWPNQIPGPELGWRNAYQEIDNKRMRQGEVVENFRSEAESD